MFSPVGGAYSLLRQVKGKNAETKPFFVKSAKPLMQHLAQAPFDKHDKMFMENELHMKYRATDDEEESTRRAVLAMSDAFELLAVWDWLYRLEHGMDVDEYGTEITYLGNALGHLIREVDDQPSTSLDGTRVLGKSVGASYFAHKSECMKYLGIDTTDKAYRVRVNLLFKYYLDLPPIYTEETDDGIQGTN